MWMQTGVLSSSDLKSLLLHDKLGGAVGASGKRAQGYSLKEIVTIAVKGQEERLPIGGAVRFVDPECIVPRDGKRWDVRLSPIWVALMRKKNGAFDVACGLLDSLRCSDKRCARAKVDWHVQVVYPGSPDQPVHVDDSNDRGGGRCYYTMIVPLVDDPKAGGTYFPSLDYVFTSYGGLLVFRGDVAHAGVGNRSSNDRYFLYAAVYTGKDPNCDP